MSAAFEKAQLVEAESWEILRPFIKTRVHQGRFVRVAKGRLALTLQKVAGDMLINTDDETVRTIEIKAERKHSDNVFLERWSNREHFTPGWFETLQTDLLFYHFLSSDTLHVFDFDKLRRWFYHCRHLGRPLSNNFDLAKQGVYEQLNDTWGYLVPVEVIKQAGQGAWRATYRPLELQDCGKATNSAAVVGR